MSTMDLLIAGLCGMSVFLLVPHFHRKEETLHASAMFNEPGGKGYNQAVAAKRMGAAVTFIGAVGEDGNGALCEERLRREGVRPVLFPKEGPTAFASILTDDTGENRVTVFPGAALTRDDIRSAEPCFASAGMLLLTPEIPEDAFAEAVRLAQQYHVKIVLNPAPFFPWVRSYLNATWLLTPNRAEACALLGSADGWNADLLKTAPYRTIVTLGADGAVLSENGTIIPIPACPVRATDTTGAGDCFNGALCACLLNGDPLADAARKAVRAASLSVTRAHVLDGLPYKPEVDAESAGDNI